MRNMLVKKFSQLVIYRNSWETSPWPSLIVAFILLSFQDKNCGGSTADISSPSTIVNQEVIRLDRRQKLTWYEWLKEPLLYKVSDLNHFSNYHNFCPLKLINNLSSLNKENHKREAVVWIHEAISIWLQPGWNATELECDNLRMYSTCLFSSSRL